MSRNHLQLTFIIVCCTVAQHLSPAWAEPTPPIMPHIVETPLPPAITLPMTEIPTGMTIEPLTATEAARIALQRQPSITVAKSNVASAQGRLNQAKSGLRPSAGLTAGYTNYIEDENGGTSTGLSAGVNVKQLIYDYNHTRDLVRQSEAQHQSAQAGLTRAQSDLINQVKQAFYQYVQAERLVHVNEENVKNRQQHVALAKARVQAGVGLPVDVVRAETAVSEAVLNLNVAQNSSAIARVALAQQMGLDPRTPIIVAENGQESAPQTTDFNECIDLALRQRPEIAQAVTNVQALTYGAKAAKSTNSPAVLGNAGWGSHGNTFPTDNTSLTMGVVLQWNFYDSGLTKGKVKEAEANVQSAQAQVDTTKLSIMNDVSQSYLNLKTAEQRLSTSDAEVLNAEEGLRLAQGRYSAGLGTYLDVQDAQNALFTAQTNRVNTQTTINQARAALAHALNSDLPAVTEPANIR